MTESEIIKEAIVMILDHIRTDGDIAYFSFSEVQRLETIKKKLMSGGEENDKRNNNQISS